MKLNTDSVSNTLLRTIAFIVIFLTGLTKPGFAEKVLYDGIYYNIDEGNGTASVASFARYPNVEGSLVIPEFINYGDRKYTVTEIGENAFNWCNGLTSVTIPNSVTKIGKYAFQDCHDLISVTIPNSITEISDYTFSGCFELTSLTIPNSVTKIGEYAFWATGLTSVTIPSSVTEIGASAFKQHKDYMIFEFESIESLCRIKFGLFWCGMGSSNPHYLMINGEIIKDLIIPDTVETIGDNAFQGCSGLTSVIIGNSVTKIGENAFYSCKDLTTVIIGNSVTKIDYEAFAYSRSLTSVEILNSVTSIGFAAFRGCSGLTSVTIPNSVTEIDDYAFEDCSGLTSVEIPNSVTSIGFSAFTGCSGLTSVTIPNSVTSIGKNAFRGCSGLTSVEIPNSVTSIGFSTFEDCSGLTSVTIPNSVTSIGLSAFADCSGLTSVTIPNSVTSIGDGVFRNCIGLKEIRIEDGEEPLVFGKDVFNGVSLTSLYLGRNFTCTSTSSSQFPFSNHRSLTTLTIGDSVTEIGEYAFYGCSGLNGSLIIGNSVTNIKSYAFWGTYFNYIYLPKSLKYIGYMAFVNDDPTYSPDKIVCDAITPPRVSTDTISSFYYSPLYVPKTSVEEYRNAPFWKNFYDIREMEEISAEEINLDKEFIKLNVGETLTLKAIVSPENATDQTIVWRSDNPDVAEVSEDGTITAISVGVATIFASCGEVTASCEVTVNPVLAEEIILNVEDMTLRVGESSQIIASVMPENATDQTIVWCSDNPDVAEVSEDGTITAISVGVATIYASCGEVTASCEVTVNPVLAEEIILNVEDMTLRVGESSQLIASVMPENTTDKTIAWSSSDESVATISDDGLVTGVSEGEAIITAQCNDIYTSCKVLVQHYSGIEEVLIKTHEAITIFNTSGIAIRISSPEDIMKLIPGIYIYGKEKILIR